MKIFLTILIYTSEKETISFSATLFSFLFRIAAWGVIFLLAFTLHSSTFYLRLLTFIFLHNGLTSPTLTSHEVSFGHLRRIFKFLGDLTLYSKSPLKSSPFCYLWLENSFLRSSFWSDAHQKTFILKLWSDGLEERSRAHLTSYEPLNHHSHTIWLFELRFGSRSWGIRNRTK